MNLKGCGYCTCRLVSDFFFFKENTNKSLIPQANDLSPQWLMRILDDLKRCIKLGLSGPGVASGLLEELTNSWRVKFKWSCFPSKAKMTKDK